LNKGDKCCDEAETARTECGQLQQTEAPDRVTRIASLTEDQSDASTWPLPGFMLAYTSTGILKPIYRF